MPPPRPWLAHYDPWTPATLSYPEHSLSTLLDIAAREVPDRPATAFLGATLTYRELKEQADRFAHALHTLGVRAGDRVGLMLPTCPQYAIAAFAVLRLGAIVVNINPAYSPREFAGIVADSGLTRVVTLPHLVSLVRAREVPVPVDSVIVTSLDEYSADGAPEARVEGTLAFRDLCAEHQPALAPQVGVTPDAIAVLQYTGGTTGLPRAAALTHRSIVANVVQTEAFTERTRTRGQARILVVLPYFHIFGFTVGLMKGVWMGALQILVPKFDPLTVLEAVRNFTPTYFPAVPTVWTSLADHPQVASVPWDRVGICTSGAAPLTPDLLTRFEARTGRPLFEGFGLTEASPVTHSTPQLAPRRPGSVGLPLPDTYVIVVDLESGQRVLPPGEPGELCVAGPQIMQGYWRRPAETARALRIHADGRRWLHTGDIATIDTDGFTRIVGRVKDLIIVDGFSVFPSEVEAVLRQHPAVHLAAVIGAPDRYHGEVVHAVVVPKAGVSVVPDDLVVHCRRQLAAYKVPVHIDVRTALPVTSVGKVLYRVLRDQRAATTEPT